MPVVILGSPGPILVTDGTNIAAVKPASTPAAGSDPALVVALSPGSPMPPPASLPLPTGAATQTTLAAVLAELDVALSTRASQATLASVLAATGATAVSVSSIDGHIDATLSSRATEATLATRAADATLTSGAQKAIARGGAKGATVAADVTSTASGADHQTLDVAIYDAAGNQVTTFGGGTQFADGAVRGTATGTLMMVDDGVHVQSASGDTAGKLNVNALVTDGVNAVAVKAASVAPLATDPALVVAISPNSTISVSSGALAGTDGLSTQLITARKRNGLGEMSVSDEQVRSRLDEIWIFMKEVYERTDQTVPAGGIKGIIPISSTKTGLTAAQTFLQANTARQTVVIVNDSTGILYLRYVPSNAAANVGRVTSTNYTYKLFSQDRFEMPLNQWLGAIEGIWDTASGTAYITEIC